MNTQSRVPEQSSAIERLKSAVGSAFQSAKKIAGIATLVGATALTACGENETDHRHDGRMAADDETVECESEPGQLKIGEVLNAGEIAIEARAGVLKFPTCYTTTETRYGETVESPWNLVPKIVVSRQEVVPGESTVDPWTFDEPTEGPDREITVGDISYGEAHTVTEEGKPITVVLPLYDANEIGAVVTLFVCLTRKDPLDEMLDMCATDRNLTAQDCTFNYNAASYTIKPLYEKALRNVTVGDCISKELIKD